MNSVKYKKLTTQTIAHRGLSGIECENTCAAFVAAGNRSYFGIETDVHITADGKFVVIHDDNTARVSDINLEVEKSTLSKLREIRLQIQDGYQREDYIIPTLEEYIDICKRYEKTAVLELKNTFEADDIRKIVDIIKEREYLNSVIFISFQLENLKTLRKLLPSQKLQYLVSEFNNDILQKLKEYKLDIDIEYQALDKNAVRVLKSNDIKINCWTCDDKDYAEKLVKMGVDFITSNILE